MTNQTKLKILVIDDEATQRLLVKDYLEGAGHTVRQAEDGRRGLKMATTTKPDLVLLDLRLPSMDGYSLCRSLKKTPETANIPVILITAERESNVIEKGLAAGADDFVTKPVDWAFLADRVVNVWNKSRERTRLVDRARESRALKRPEPSADGHGEPVLATSIEDLLNCAELQAAQSDSVAAAQLDRMVAEHKAELEHALAQARAEAEARIAHIQHETQNKAAAEVEAARAELTSEFDAAVARSVAGAIEAHARQEAARLEEQQSRHDEEMIRVQERCQAENAAARAASERERSVAERRHAQEIAGLRVRIGELEQVLSEQGAQQAGEARSENEARLSAAWSLGHRWASAQAEVASALHQRAQTLREGKASPEQLVELERVSRSLCGSIGHFKMLCDALAQGSKSGSQAAPALSVAGLVSDIATQAAGPAQARNVRIACFAGGEELLVAGDQRKLRYAILSLVINAVRFTPSGGTVTIQAGLDETGNVQIDVTDTGVGIAPARLRDAVQCLDSPPSTCLANVSEGAGLGIPLAIALTRGMGGTLNMGSQLGAGTRASLVLPRFTPSQSEEYSEIAVAY